jgi:hypothetical protein
MVTRLSDTTEIEFIVRAMAGIPTSTAPNEQVVVVLKALHALGGVIYISELVKIQQLNDVALANDVSDLARRAIEMSGTAAGNPSGNRKHAQAVDDFLEASHEAVEWAAFMLREIDPRIGNLLTAMADEWMNI